MPVDRVDTGFLGLSPAALIGRVHSQFPPAILFNPEQRDCVQRTQSRGLALGGLNEIDGIRMPRFIDDLKSRATFDNDPVIDHDNFVAD